MVNEDNIEENGDEETSGKVKGGKTLVLLQDFEGYCIYCGASSFVVYKPKNVFGGYFTSIGSCVREVYKCMLADKAMNRENHMKRDMDSLMNIIESTTAQMKMLTANLDNIVLKMLSDKKEKEKKEKVE
jgi:uncharacterized protein YwgA